MRLRVAHAKANRRRLFLRPVPGTGFCHADNMADCSDACDDAVPCLGSAPHSLRPV